MEILNCDGLSQFYFEHLLALGYKFEDDDNTIFYIILRACEYVKRGIANFYQFSRVAEVKEKE